jgi:hypothetical protein
VLTFGTVRRWPWPTSPFRGLPGRFPHVARRDPLGGRAPGAGQLRQDGPGIDLIVHDSWFAWPEPLARHLESSRGMRVIRAVKRQAGGRRVSAAAAVSAAAVIAAVAGLQLTRPGIRTPGIPVPPGNPISVEDHATWMVAVSQCAALGGLRLGSGFRVVQARPYTGGGPLAVLSGQGGAGAHITGLPPLCALILGADTHPPTGRALALLPLPLGWNGHLQVAVGRRGMSQAAVAVALRDGSAVAETADQADGSRFAAAAKTAAIAFYGAPVPLLANAIDIPPPPRGDRASRTPSPAGQGPTPRSSPKPWRLRLW